MGRIHEVCGNPPSLADSPLCSAIASCLRQGQVAEDKTQASHAIPLLTWELQYFEEFKEQVNWVQALVLDYIQVQGYTS